MEGKIYTLLPRIAGHTSEEHFLEIYAETLVPSLCTKDGIAKLDKLIGNNTNMPVYVVKPLRIGRQENERCERE